MKHIPLNANVVCTDGLCGLATCVTIDPETFQVTHIAVKQSGGAQTDRLVPVDRIEEITSDQIRLNCTSTELADMPSFTTTEFRQVEVPRYIADGYTTHSYVPEITRMKVETEQVPKGEFAVSEGAEVVATDGPVGHVDELWFDPTTGNVTHLILREDHILGDTDVILPVSVIQSATSDTVHLKVNHDMLSSLLAIPVAQRQRAEDIELIVYVVKNLNESHELWDALKPLAAGHGAAVLNAALLVKEQDGTTALREIEDIGPRRGTLFGAITGGIIGLVGGPIGIVVGAAAGAATGGIAARKIDMGFPDEYLQKLQDHLRPDSSAIVALVKKEGIDKVTAALSTFKGQLLQQEVTEDLAGKLTERVAFERDASND